MQIKQPQVHSFKGAPRTTAGLLRREGFRASFTWTTAFYPFLTSKDISPPRSVWPPVKKTTGVEGWLETETARGTLERDLTDREDVIQGRKSKCYVEHKLFLVAQGGGTKWTSLSSGWRG